MTVGARVSPGTPGRRAWSLVQRNVLAYRRQWPILLSGLAEPILYLLSIGIGVGALVGELPGPGGTSVPYRVFAAPGLMAAATMNGSVIDTTFNFFVKWKYTKTYDAILATPVGVADVAVGEVAWAVLRGALHAVGFLGAMLALGLVRSPWAVLAVPGALLIGVAFAGAGLAAATWMRSFVDFDYVTMALVPLFLFSATFFPIERYPGPLQAVVRLTPLYQGVALERALVLGGVDLATLGHAAYLAAMGAAGVWVAARRLVHHLQP